MTARVLAVVDAYDAMNADRPHRPPLTEAEVQQELVMNRGTRYDPQCVDALLAVLDESHQFQAPATSADVRFLL